MDAPRPRLSTTPEPSTTAYLLHVGMPENSEIFTYLPPGEQNLPTILRAIADAIERDDNAEEMAEARVVQITIDLDACNVAIEAQQTVGSLN